MSSFEKRNHLRRGYRASHLLCALEEGGRIEQLPVLMRTALLLNGAELFEGALELSGASAGCKC